MESELNCQTCTNEYREDNLPRLLTACGHTYCENCLDTMMTQYEGGYKISCPEDGNIIYLKSHEITQFPKNIALIKVIESKKQINNNNFKNEDLQITKIPKKEDSRGDETEQQLINEMKQSSQTDVEKVSNNSYEQSVTKIKNNTENRQQQEQNMCLLHCKPLDVVCLVDLERICAKCAIFGQHKGHEFKSIEHIMMEGDQHRDQIMQIYKKQQEIAKRIENQQSKKDFIAILNQKKAKLAKEINDKYKKLYQKIKRSEESAIKKMEEKIVKAQSKIKKLLEKDENLFKEYFEWQKQSFGNLLIFEDGSFEQKLQILYGKNSNHSSSLSIIDKGFNLVDKIEKSQQKAIIQAENIIDNIQNEFSQEIYSKLENFVRTIDKAEENTKLQQVHQKQNVSFEKIPVSSLSDESLLETENLELNKNYFNQFSDPQTNLNSFPITNFSSKKQIRFESSNKIKDYEDINSVIQQNKYERPNKKKLKSIKVPQKVQKLLEQLYNDTLDTLDLTNCELGDAIILQICEFLRGSKVRTVKFIRNKLSDDVIPKMMNALSYIATLNLSQNLLTQATIDNFINHRQMMPNMKSIILSQNKIIERKHKILIDKLRKLDLTVSV